MLKIKEIRESKNLKQDEVVELSGIKKRSYVDYENGKADIPLSKLQSIATALNVSIAQLTGEGEMFKKEGPDIDYKEEAVRGLIARVKLLEKSVDTLNTALVVQSGIFQKEVSVNRSKKIDPEIFNSVKHFYKNDLSEFDIEDLKKTYVFLSDEIVSEQTSLYESVYKTE